MASAPSPENNHLIENIIKCLLATMSKEDLQQLLTQDDAWDTVKTKAGLSREEADDLCEALKARIADLAVVDVDRLQQVQKAKERYFSKFLKLREIEEDIQKLRELADQVDHMHWGCTVSSVVAGSTTAGAAALGILGLLLAPFTAGLSTVLTGEAAGLAVASGLTGAVTGIVEYSNVSSALREAQNLVPRSKDKLMDGMKEVGYPAKAVSSTENWSHYLRDIWETISAIKQAKCDSDLIVSATFNMVVTNILIASGKHSSSLSTHLMNIGERATLSAAKIISFVTDNINLVENAKHLHEGAKSEFAEELRHMAQTLESSLEDLKEIKTLMSDSNQ